ncbi:hypothetical protein AGMMS50276_20970 [Synergistales bacterium]|nr:hypothetical protein AGMMS50276_20970 [Synergistales bacterium]
MNKEMTSQEIMCKGMQVLRDALGVIEAEKFYFLVRSEEPFDYTEWRKEQPWYDMSFEEIRASAHIHCPQKSFGLDE